MSKRYFIGDDYSGSSFLVPLENREEWEQWANLDEADPAAWEAPAYAKRLNGGPGSIISFTDPVIDEVKEDC